MKQIYKAFSYFVIFTIISLMGCTKDVDIQDQFDFKLEVLNAVNGYVFETSPFNIKITPQRVVQGTTYKYSYKILEGDSSFETVSPSTPIPVDESYTFESLETVLNFIPKKIGNNVILISVEDNHGNIKTEKITYKADYAPFVFLLTPNLSTYTINSKGAVTSTIIRKEEDSFIFSYLVENGTGIFYDGTTPIPVGVNYVVKGGVNQLNYMPSTIGTHKISATVTASDNAKINRVVELKVDNIPFTLSATATSTSINVNQELDITIDLSEQLHSNTTYEISHSFDPKGISGTVKNASGAIIGAGVFVPINLGVYKYKFKPSGTGISTITFKVKDNNGQIKEATIIITVENVMFTFTGVPSEKTVLLNQNTQLNFNLVPNANDSNGVNYSCVYQSIEGNGELKNADGSRIQSGTPLSVSKGTFNFQYNPSTLGIHKLDFVVTDNNGEKRTVSIEMTAVHTPVTFNVSTVSQTYVNQSIPLNFIVTPQSSTNLNYQMNYYVSGGEGKLVANNKDITAGNFFDVNRGSFQYQFTPTIAGNYTLTFQLKDSNGQLVTKEVVVVVANNKFSFTPTPSQTVFVNEQNSFSYALVPTGNYANTTYNLSYTIESGQLGSIYQDGTEVQQGIPVKVVPTAFKLVYKPTTVGEHKIKYIVTDSNGLSEEIIQTVNVVAADFNFTTQQANETIYKNNKDVLLLSLSQTQINPNIIYSLTYSITGVGQLLDNGVPLNNFSVITPGNHSYTFLSTQSGVSKIEFTLLDTNGIVHKQTVNYTVINPDFNLSTTGDGTLFLGKNKPFSLFISQVLTDNTASYQVRYLLESGSTGNGTLSNGTVDIPFGIFQDINLGSTSLNFKGIQTGTANIKVEVKDSNGVIHTSIVAFDIIGIGYTFTGAFQSNSIFVNGSTPINFDITEFAPSDTNYEMKYAITSGVGEIKNGATVEAANVWSSVSIGNFNRTFVGTSAGTVKLLFTVRNKTTLVEKTQAVEIVVNSSVFSFTASGTSNNQITSTPVNVNFNVAQTGGGADTYSLIFNTSSTGTFTYGGITYTAGQVIPFVVGSSNGSYKGTVGGVHDITFTASNQNNVSKTASVSMNYINNDFTLSSSGDGSLNINSSKTANIFLSQASTDPSITYEVKYSVASGSIGNGTLSNGSTAIALGTYQPINTGTSQISFTGTAEGIVNIEVTVKNSNGITHTSTLSFNVVTVGYTFTGASQSNSVFVNGSTPINFDITESGASGTNYEMKYAITSGVGEIKNGATVEAANVWSSVSIGNFNRTFVGTSAGTVKLLFTVRNKTTLVEKTQAVEIVVNSSVFSFTASGTSNNQITSTPVNVNFNVAQTGGGADTYSLIFNTSSTGTFTYGGITYTAGQVIPFVVGSSNGSYKGTVGGVHDITFTASNQNNVSKTASVSMNYINNDFTLSSSGDGSLNINSSKTANIFLSQASTDPSITYEVKYSVASGSIGNGTLSNGSTAIALGTYQPINTGTSQISFTGTAEGIVNIEVTVKNSNGITHTSTLSFNVVTVGYTFTGASQSNSVFVNGSTPINFDITESGASGTNYEMKYAITSGVGEIKNGATVEAANVWSSVSIGNFNRTFVGTSAGTVKLLFTVRNKTTLVEKTQAVEIVVNSSVFSFTASGTSNNQITSTPVNVNFNVAQTGGGADTYSLIFNTSSTGTFTYGGITYTAGQVIPFVVGSSNGSYKGTVGGVHDITFTASNQNNVSKTASVSMNYINNDFTLSSSGDGSLNINSSKTANIFLSQASTDPSITYEVKYSVASGSIGNGTLSNGSTAIALGTYQPINTGTSQISFTGTAEGIVNIEVTVKNSNGITHTSTLSFNVVTVGYTFTGASQSNSVFVNGSTPINFDITESGASGTNYEMKYAITSGVGEIKNGATVEAANVWSSVSIGNFNRTFVGTSAGTVKLLFTVRNKTTLVEKTQAVEIVVNSSVFSFTASGTSNNQITSTPVNVNFNVAQTGGGADTYSLIFNTSSTGTFTYGGITYTAGQVIPFVVGSSNGSYKGTVGGVHDITFTASNQNNVSKTASVSLKYINTDFTLSSSGDGTLNINTTKNFNVFLSQANTDNTVTYEVKYTIGTGTVGNGEILNGGTNVPLGTYQSIALGSSQLTFKGTGAGLVNIEVTVKDSNNVIHTSTLAFNVKEVDYTFTGASQSNSVFVNGSTPINFDITESGASGTNYEMKYAITSGVGEIKNGATVETANVWSSVSIGNFNRTFVGTSVGTVKVLFTVRNKTTLVEKTQLISVTVNPSEFSFNATRTNTGQVVNTPVNVNLNLTQTGGTGDTYNLIFNTSSTGTFKYGGITYTAGQIIPFVIGSSTGEYVGTVSGNHDITFTATNQFNISKTSSVSLNYINNDYTLSSSGDGSLYVNQTKDFNVFLSQLIPDAGLTYQVKYSFDTGTTGNGTITNGGSPVALGSYQPISLGSNLLTFNASALGIVNLLIEVKNSNGLLKSTVVMFDAKTTEFLFTGGAQSNTTLVNGITPVNFDLSEVVPSGTNYEMSFYASVGNAIIKDAGTTLNPYQWYDITTGSFQRELTALTQGNITIVFTVRNKTTLQTKTVTATVNAYQKPTLTNIRTGVEVGGSYNCGGGSCTRDYRYLLSFSQTLNTGATLTEIIMTIRDSAWNLNRTFVITNFVHNYGGYIMFKMNSSDLNNDWQFGGQAYTLTAKDSNGYTNVYTGIFTDSTTDFQ